jgi:hypothetical protein
VTHPADRDRRRPAEDDGSAYGTQSNNSQRVANAPGSSSINQYNTLSTPVLLAAIVCFFVAGAMGGIAIGMANTASYKAGLAEREARLAQEDLILLRAKVAAAGIQVESAGDHE